VSERWGAWLLLLLLLLPLLLRRFFQPWALVLVLVLPRQAPQEGAPTVAAGPWRTQGAIGRGRDLFLI
jgi:hypothetical protein